MGKGEIGCNEQFLLFPQCFLSILKTFCNFHQLKNCRLQTLSIWKSLKFVIWERVNFVLWYKHDPAAFNSLPDDKILDWSKLKALADKNLNVNNKLKPALGRVENIV